MFGGIPGNVPCKLPEKQLSKSYHSNELMVTNFIILYLRFFPKLPSFMNFPSTI